MGSEAKPQPLYDLVHISAKKNASGDNTVMDFDLQFSGMSESVKRYISYIKHSGSCSITFVASISNSKYYNSKTIHK